MPRRKLTAPMRLFLATGIFHPESGGPATYLHGLLPEALVAGHAVRLLTFGDPTPRDGDYGYPVQRIPRGPLPLRPLAYARYGLAARPLAAWADVIYIQGTGLPVWGIPAGTPRALKVVGDPAWERAVRLGWVPPTEDVDAFQTRRYAPQVEYIKAARDRDAQRMARVIVPSQYLKRMVVGWGVDEAHVQVIYNALSAQAIAARTALTQAEARAQLGLGPEPLLLCVARLTAWKGVEPLIRAVAAQPDARLIVAGDGPLLEPLRHVAATSGAGERIQLLGRVPREKVAILMTAADYTVLYSGYEGLSHTLLESLHAGTPVIASDKGGNPEVVIEGVNGLLVPYVDQAALTATIRAALQPGVRDRLAAGTSQGLERFTWERLVRETLASLESLAG